VLQFATEDTEPAPAATARPTMPAPSAAKTASPAKIAATNERDSVDPTPVDKPSPAASAPAQSERFEAPAPSQMRVIVPVPIETPVTTSTPQDQPQDEPLARSNSSTAQMPATLAGAITAGIVGWLIFGFGSFRTIKSRQI